MNVRERFLDVDKREELIKELLADSSQLFHWEEGKNDDIRFGFVVGCRAAFYRLINDRTA
jgi:hypothetical protein